MEKVLKKVDELHEYYVNLLKDMVSIATVVPPGENYKEFVEYGKEVLKDLGMEVSVVEVPKDYLAKHIPEMKDNPRYILLGRLKGDGKTTLHFNGHYDVVPPGAG